MIKMRPEHKQLLILMVFLPPFRWLKVVRCLRRLTDEYEYEAEGLESFTYSSTIKVECYRLFEYSVAWNLPMSPKRSSRQPKSSKKNPQRSPSPNEVIQRMWRVNRPRTRLRVTDADTFERQDLDIIDIINSSTDCRQVAEEEEDDEEEGQFVEVTDGGVDNFDEDCDTSSIASGPSLRHSSVSHQIVKPPQGLCSACKTLYQKTNKKKAPLKKNLLDNNPKSLTCDQWVLVKSWRPRRLPNARGKLLTCVQWLKERLAVQKGSKGPAQYVVESSACSKPHTFLQRNLRRRVRTSVIRGRRKRTRDGSQDRRAAKQQRLHSNNRGQRVSIGAPDFDDRSSDDSQADANLTPESIPSSVALETTDTSEVPPGQKASQTWGFRVLLAQLRGNGSMIVRE